MDGMIDDDVIALDIRFNPSAPMAEEMKGFAAGLFQLHCRAHQKWPDGIYYQRAKVDGCVLSVELRDSQW